MKGFPGLMKCLVFVLLAFTVLECNAQKSDYEQIMSETLENSELKKFLHLDLESRTPVFIYKNEWIEDELSLEGLSYEVQIVDDTTGTNGNIIRFLELSVDDSTAKFSLYYKIENMSMRGTLKKIVGKWHMDKIDEIIEF